MEDFYEYQSSLLIPLTIDETIVPIFNNQILETQTLFEIKSGNVDKAAIQFSLNGNKIQSMDREQFMIEFVKDKNENISFKINDFLNSKSICSDLAILGFSLTTEKVDLRITINEENRYGHSNEILNQHLFQTDKHTRNGWQVSFFANPENNYIININGNNINKIQISPIRYKAKISKSNTKLTTSFTQKLLAECNGRIETIVPSLLLNKKNKNCKLDLEIFKDNKKIRSIDFGEINIQQCDLKVTNAQLNVISDNPDIFLSIDDIFFPLPEDKIISLRAFNDDRSHEIKVFSKYKVFKLAETTIRFPRYYTPINILEKFKVFDKEEVFTREQNYLSFLSNSENNKNHTELINFLNYRTSLEEFSISKAKYEINSNNAQTTIIIPVYNQLEITLRCLSTLALVESDNKFRITIVDDCSHDDLSLIKFKFPNVHVLRNKKNQGFIGSINLGLETVKTKYVLMLNNDTEVTNYFLDELINVFFNFRHVGLVGSKLLFKDSTLQEAGCLLWKNGVPWNYGRNQNAFNSRFRYTREVDYCSGACLLSKTSILKEVGGLSEYLKPAYFDDADLAMKIKEIGKKVYFAAKSLVFHIEGVSNGTSTETGIKSFQQLNASKFSKKWGETFKHRPNPSLNYVHKLAETFYNKKALFIDYETPRENKDAGGFAAINEMKMFQELGYKVDFLPENLAYFGSATNALERNGIRCINHPEIFSVKEYLETHINDYNVVFITRFNVAENYVELLKNSKSMFFFNNADLHFLREYRHLSKGEQTEKVKEIRKRELTIIEASDLSFCYTETEKQIIESHILQKDKIKIMPWVTNLKVDKSVAKLNGKFGFLGSYHHKPNQEAVHYIKTVLSKECKDLDFIVGGFGWEKEKKANFENVGEIKDLKDFFGVCRALIVPLNSGAGIKGKIFEALSYGVPIISTPIGAEGIPLDQKEIGFIIDLESFHISINSLIKTHLGIPKEFEKMTVNALNYVEKYHSFGTGVKSLASQLKIN